MFHKCYKIGGLAHLKYASTLRGIGGAILADAERRFDQGTRVLIQPEGLTDVRGWNVHNYSVKCWEWISCRREALDFLPPNRVVGLDSA